MFNLAPYELIEELRKIREAIQENNKLLKELTKKMYPDRSDHGGPK